MEQKVTPHTTKGLILSLILIVLSLVINFTGNELTGWGRWLWVPILCAGVIWACITYGKQKGGNVTFGNVFAHGFKTTAVVTVIIIAFTVVYMLLMPEMKEKALETARTEMEKNPNMTESQIQQTVDFTSRVFYVFLIGGIIILYLVVGLIASLIGAAATKRNPQTPFSN